MTYTILNSKKGNNNKFNYESINFDFTPKKTDKNYLDNLLNDAYKKFLPWMKTSKKEDKKEYIILEIPEPDLTYKPINVTPYALNLEWNKAATRLLEIAYYLDHPSYDYMIGDTPIKIHGNYIQVGSTIIPTYSKAKDFTKFDKATQINLYNIAVTINMIAA